MGFVVWVKNKTIQFYASQKCIKVTQIIMKIVPSCEIETPKPDNLCYDDRQVGFESLVRCTQHRNQPAGDRV
ncbi:MAG: hypothetical protein D3926_08625 [Desulfobacteraceae bacterium]|nr:MAG: hypothetical protein D3926_08625 [Desulfobacteraceae bacterium]